MNGLSLSLVRGAATSPFKRVGRPGAVLPAGRVVLPPAPVPPGPLAAYSRICGFAEPDPVPLTYPHVLGFPPAMRLMTRRDFPLPVLGLVHTWIEITGHRTLHPADELGLTVYADGLTPHRRGTEVTIVTEARLGGELVWESRSGYLSRHATGATAAPAPPPAASPDLPAVAQWRLPSGLGRRYAAASGDRNPIHLHPLTARLFGFPRHIAHGMWTVARCLAEAGTGDGAGEPRRIRSVRADFKAPVLLPATVTYAAAGAAFQVRSGSRVHLTGSAARGD
ncbi:MAG TPA: MaoC/PaaZ C-terminal domain-containing protein [Streptomyces sp.]|uniref:MaoC/PaaZ C-terminal domain-containing protein n=1 Tax=Streptomyces sp. TaxID=1931 RepID=UPI002C17B31D|nr:MaoC/PaaZ C-terminal domain-containing protein [Streptomyces sp.]HWU08130.1 MaoC/PaaZ C-terminal domain-containing protein [Streptomyces sp.]